MLTIVSNVQKIFCQKMQYQFFHCGSTNHGAIENAILIENKKLQLSVQDIISRQKVAPLIKEENTTHCLCPLGAPKYQNYHVVHTKVQTMFSRGHWELEPPINPPLEQCLKGTPRHDNHDCQVRVVFGQMSCTITNRGLDCVDSCRFCWSSTICGDFRNISPLFRFKIYLILKFVKRMSAASCEILFPMLFSDM